MYSAMTAVDPRMDDVLHPADVTILGVGNVILRDEGFGVRAAEYLDAHYDFPESVQVVDGGTLGRQIQLVERDDWHSRLLFGTDYPLPGILPLVSLRRLAVEHMLSEAAVPVLETLREHNPQLSERVRRRQLHASSLFETRRFSDRKPA